VWPSELRNPDYYTKHGKGDLGKGNIDDPHAEHKISDFEDLRDLYLDNKEVLNFLAKCYKYWIALTDIDGFRIDTLKHVSKEQARNFCGAIKEYAAKLGKTNFLLVGEVAGGDDFENVYMNAVPRNLDCVLDIGELRTSMFRLAKGLDYKAARDFFSKFEVKDEWNFEHMPSHRAIGKNCIIMADDHDNIGTSRIRFAYKTPQHQVLACIALQMLCLGIPCIYYGTEQEFRGPEENAYEYLVDEGWGESDRYLREAMFGPTNPLEVGAAGINGQRSSLQGFGPFGTSGVHCFDQNYYVYKKTKEIIDIRKKYSAFRYGRQYQRQTSYLTYPFSLETQEGQIVAWSRILDSDEFVCILNTHGTEKRGARVVVDSRLNNVGERFKLILNTSHNTNYSPPQELPVQEGYGCKFVEFDKYNLLEPSTVLIYMNSEMNL